jgi:hypothetical protein
MKGIISKTVSVACLSAGLVTAQGCATYHDVVDPCYPKRYSAMARQEALQGFGTQVHNGHILEQTVWNADFERASDQLTPGGMDHLAYLARRRPAPDPVIYLQVAEDIAYDPVAPDKFVEERIRLDNLRTVAVQKYLNAQTAGRSAAFTVVLHDPPEVGMAALPQGLAVQKMQLSVQGVLRTGGSGGGGAPAGN